VSEYVGIAIFAGLILAFGVVSLAVSALLRPSGRIRENSQLRVGPRPMREAWVQVPRRGSTWSR